jgi:hypothetical protein
MWLGNLKSQDFQTIHSKVNKRLIFDNYHEKGTDSKSLAKGFNVVSKKKLRKSMASL